MVSVPRELDGLSKARIRPSSVHGRPAELRESWAEWDGQSRTVQSAGGSKITNTVRAQVITGPVVYACCQILTNQPGP